MINHADKIIRNVKFANYYNIILYNIMWGE